MLSAVVVRVRPPCRHVPRGPLYYVAQSGPVFPDANFMPDADFAISAGRCRKYRRYSDPTTFQSEASAAGMCPRRVREPIGASPLAAMRYCRFAMIESAPLDA